MKNIDFYEKLKQQSFKESSKVSSAQKYFFAHRPIFLKMNARFCVAEKKRLGAFTQETLKELVHAENRQKTSGQKSRIHF